MWLRSLIFFAIAWFIGAMMRRAFNPQSAEGRGPRPKRPGSVPDQIDDVMVRDRVCNTFLPKSQALVLNQSGVPHYFCSERCRTAFQTTPGPVEAAGSH